VDEIGALEGRLALDRQAASPESGRVIDPGPNNPGINPLLVGEAARAREVELRSVRERAEVSRGRWPSVSRVRLVLFLILGGFVALGWLLTLVNAH
jgi:hypothetical protein